MVTTLPRNLVAFQPHGTLSFLAPRASGQPERRRAPRLLGRDALLDRLEVMGEVAPMAPLSFLLIEIESAGFPARGVLEAVAERTAGMVRAVDAVGLFGAGTVGVALQGAGATAAGAVAGRLSLHLNHVLAEMAPGHRVLVHAATGCGLNALTLPMAAEWVLDESC